jgi:hypothetical protein
VVRVVAHPFLGQASARPAQDINQSRQHRHGSRESGIAGAAKLSPSNRVEMWQPNLNVQLRLSCA